MNFKSLRYPDLYHGRLGKNYFEGWYFKLVNQAKDRSFAFIPGIFFSPRQKHQHAFIQLVDGMKKTYSYERFSVQDFAASRTKFSIAIAKNTFSLDGISFNLVQARTELKGEVVFKNHLYWPDSFLNPGSMGFYNYLPKMQCYSQVCAMDFDLQGSLELNGEIIDFDGGRGYIEKNWGSAFPYSWIWIQCNHFQTERAALSCSLGHIPFPLSSFRGFLVGLYVNAKFYEFTTMNRSKVEVIQKGTDVTMRLKNRRYSLTIECETSNEDFILLNGPRGDQMVPLVQENLQGLVHVVLEDNLKRKVIFDAKGSCAGVEYGGEQMLVLD